LAYRGILTKYRHFPHVVGGRLAVAGLGAAVLIIVRALRLVSFYGDFIRKGGGEAATLGEAFRWPS